MNSWTLLDRSTSSDQVWSQGVERKPTAQFTMKLDIRTIRLVHNDSVA